MTIDGKADVGPVNLYLTDGNLDTCLPVPYPSSRQYNLQVQLPWPYVTPQNINFHLTIRGKFLQCKWKRIIAYTTEVIPPEEIGLKRYQAGTYRTCSLLSATSGSIGQSVCVFSCSCVTVCSRVFISASRQLPGSQASVCELETTIV